ncbi:MmcQ/YjbR family DNA-binding protein [Ruminococcus sp.]|uniref:MmcQ/YjbR family DNA-binding protein n=1 Tax=Ruminococcus sp. TaxID=41978 RepID=UPI0025E4F7EA|nr:MmcQ/YjbR family DNA-binding protein [Ruminococcus sp.]
MTKEKYLEFCSGIAGACCDMPFNEDFETTALRHIDTRKWFGLLMKLDGKYIVNLKLSPEEVLFYQSVYKGACKAYHMNKTHWITIYLDSDVPDDEIENLTLISFGMTAKKAKNRPKM